MKFQPTLLLCFILIFSSQVFAQEISKEEKKKWVKIAKQYKKDPASLKMLTEERDQYRRQAQDTQRQMNNAQAGEAQAQNNAAILQADVARLDKELMEAKALIRRLTMENERFKAAMKPTTPTNEMGNNAGIVFRVQVGAFTTGRIPQKFQNMPDMIIEREGNTQKVLLGNYRGIDDARSRVNQLKRQGTTEAFVVAYKDGKRISISEALRN